MMSTPLDFTITGTVFLHNQAWKRGQESELQAAGFTDEDKAHQVRCGMIEWHREAPAIDATDGAVQAAAEAGVDLADVQHFVGGGRVGKPDVDRYVKEHATEEDSE